MTFSADELRRRRERAAAAVEGAALDVLVVSLNEHLTYLLGHTFHDLGRPGAGLLGADGSLRVWVGEPVEAPADVEVEAVEDARETIDAVIAGLRRRRPRSVGYEGDWYALRYAERERLRAGLPDADWREATHLLTELRLVKSPEEVAIVRRAAALADAGMEAALAVASPGVRELDLAAAAAERLAREGSEYSSFPGLVGSGPRSGHYHPLPTGRRLEAGDAVEIEVTGAVARYNSNLVRTVFAGAASAEQRALYEIVAEAFHAGVDAVAPGTPVGVVDDVTRRVRERYSDYIPSRAGYGIELSYPPFLTGALSILSGAPHVFEPGMVFSLEPSIAGYREQTVILGCNVLVTDQGAEILHRSPRGLAECG